MKRLLTQLPALGAFLLTSPSSFALPQGKYGLGLIIGEPTGFNLQTFLGPNTGFSLALAWSFVETSGFYAHGDYQHYILDLGAIESQQGELSAYIGVGVRVKVWEDKVKVCRTVNDVDITCRTEDDSTDVGLALRIPLGLNYQFTNVPVDTFVEVVPAMEFVPETDFDPAVAAGVRYYL